MVKQSETSSRLPGPRGARDTAARWIAKYGLLLAFTGVGLVALLPIWAVRYLPFLDLPQHLSVIHVLAHYDEPRYRYAEFLELKPVFTTYLVYYRGSALLAQFMSVEAASKVFISLYVLGLPASLMVALRAFRRNPWFGFLGFPLVYSYPLFMGFVSFCLALPLLFLGLALWESMLRRPTRARQVLAALHLPLVFFTHALVMLLTVGVVGLLLLAHHWRQPGTLLKRAALCLVGLGVFAAWQVSMSRAGDLAGAEAPPPDAEVTSDLGLQYRPLDEKLTELSTSIIGQFPGTKDDWVLAAWLLLLLAYLVTRQPVPSEDRRGPIEAGNAEGPPAPSTPDGVAARGPPHGDAFYRHRLEVVAWVLCALYFAAPVTVKGVWAVSTRIPLVAASALVLLLNLNVRRAWAHLVFVPMLVLACVHAHYVRDRFEAFQEEVGPLDEVLAAIPDGQKVYSLIYSNGSEAAGGAAFVHFGCYYMLAHGGLTSFSFAQYPATPITHRNISEFPHTGFRTEWSPNRFRYELYGQSYDYFLVRDANPARRLRSAEPNVELVLQAGQWAVFRNVSRGEIRREVVTDLRNRVASSEVRLIAPDGQAMACDEWQHGHWQCPPEPWAYVGQTVVRSAGLELPCIWAHPYRDFVTEVRFPDVELADQLTGFITLADSAFGGGEGAPIELEIALDGTPLDTLVQENVRGRQDFGFDTSDRAGESVELVFRVHTTNDRKRHFCFDAQTVSVEPVEP